MNLVGVDATEVPGVQALRAEARNETIDRKSEYPTKEQDSKTTVEPKKKPLDFKVKPDQKYQKSFKDDDAKRGDTNDATTNSDDETTARSMETMGVTIPLLLRGEPILATVDAPTSSESSSASEHASSTEEARVTEETMSFRGRALNISAPEPTNSLHSNITDLSDVSMDDDDKEVEGDCLLSCTSRKRFSLAKQIFLKCGVERGGYKLKDQILTAGRQ